MRQLKKVEKRSSKEPTTSNIKIVTLFLFVVVFLFKVLLWKILKHTQVKRTQTVPRFTLVYVLSHV